MRRGCGGASGLVSLNKVIKGKSCHKVDSHLRPEEEGCEPGTHSRWTGFDVRVVERSAGAGHSPRLSV